MQATIQYAKSGDVHIAYQVIGSGPLDLVLVPASFSHLEFQWEDASSAHFLDRLASFARVILFDKRGTGLSDRVSGVRPLEERMDDVRAVMDAVGSERAALVGVSEGAAMSILFGATYPERTSALVVYGSLTGQQRPSLEVFEQVVEMALRDFGKWSGLSIFAPSRADDQPFQDWFVRLQRMAISPGAVETMMRMVFDIDIRHVLPSVRVPTLVLHRAEDRAASVENGRLVAQQIPSAKYIELPGADHLHYVGDADLLLDEIEEFLTGVRPGPDPDRVLATVLFADIVDSTERASALGDRQWRRLLDDFYRCLRREVSRFHGREIDTAGDGLFATFDGPGRAIRCACAMRDDVRNLGIEIRAGLHTGECEFVDDKVRGIAVHLGARVCEAAGPGEVLVSRTVKDLVAGSKLRFTDRGVHTFKGVSDDWRLYVAEA